MKFRIKNNCYVIGFLTSGVLLISFNHFRNDAANTIDDCKPIKGLECISMHEEVDQELASYPWISDPTCQHLAVQFAKNKTRPKWALTSFPGSGVTWTRQLIEGVTGIYTGTVYGKTEPPIIKTGHHGNEADLNCECTILIKDHDVGLPDFASFPTAKNNLIKDNQTRKDNKKRGPIRSFLYDNRGILLLRNPMDALFTFAHYLGSSGNQIGTVSPADFAAGPQFDNYVDYVADTWADHAVGWINDIQNGTVLFYERLLLEDTEAELTRLLSVINFSDPRHPPVDPERMRCTLQHKNRMDRKRSQKPVIPLTTSQRSKLMSAIERVQQSLRKKGWPLLPVYLYDLRHKENLGV